MGSRLLIRVLAIFSLVVGLGSRGFAQAPAGKNVVLWINVDGLRHDYVDRDKPAFLTKLKNEGAYSTALVPIFPSLTFPSHLSMATGRDVSGHGVPGNSFYDTADEQERQYPADYKFVRCEAIWVTAPRQGVRASVIDWPVSHRQSGKVTADYFGQAYDNKLDDDARLELAIKPYLTDDKPQPLQLVMGYVSKVDVVGHAEGPDSPKVAAELKKVDAILEAGVKRVIERFDQRMGPQDELYVIITTDHGMSACKTQVSAERMLGDAYEKDLMLNASGPILHVFVNKLPEAQRAAKVKAILDQLKKHDFVANAWAKSDIPAPLGLSDPTRVGDVVVSLKSGYTVTRSRQALTMPVTARGPNGMHGYDVAADPNMKGWMVIWRYRKPIGGKDLGEVGARQLYPTVCKLLNVQPAEGAETKAIEIP